jgi:hypothetical protein
MKGLKMASINLHQGETILAKAKAQIAEGCLKPPEIYI